MSYMPDPASCEHAPVAELGSVFEPEAEGPRGEDMHVRVDVPRAALGHTDGVRVHIPERIPHAGERVARTLDDAGEHPVLHLSEDFPQDGAVKLRGCGAPHPTGSAGDLIVRVNLTDAPFGEANAGTRSRAPLVLLFLALVASGASAAWYFLGTP